MKNLARIAAVALATSALACAAFGSTAFAKTIPVSTEGEFCQAIEDAAAGDVISLSQDIALSNSAYRGGVFAVSINGNGHTLSCNDEILNGVDEGASLTVTNTKVDASRLVLRCDGRMSVSNCEFVRAGGSVCNGVYGTAEVSGIKASGLKNVIGHVEDSAQVTVSDSVLSLSSAVVGECSRSSSAVLNNLDVTSESYLAVKSMPKYRNDDSPSVTVNGGKYRGPLFAYSLNMGTLTLNNVDLRLSNSDTGNLYIAGTNVVVNGGIYVSEAELFILDEGTLTISAGTFRSSLYSVKRFGGSLVINAGSFTTLDEYSSIVADNTGSDEFAQYWEKTLFIPVKSSLIKTTMKDVFTYTGKAIVPSSTVTFNGMTYKQGADYTVSCSGNTAVGTAKATITFKDESLSSITKPFVINPAAASVSSAKVGKRKVTVKMAKTAAGYGGSGFQVMYKQSGTSKWKTVSVSKQSRVLKKLKKGKKYQFKVRAYKKIGAKTYYGAWSKVKTSKKVK